MFAALIALLIVYTVIGVVAWGLLSEMFEDTLTAAIEKTKGAKECLYCEGIITSMFVISWPLIFIFFILYALLVCAKFLLVLFVRILK